MLRIFAILTALALALPVSAADPSGEAAEAAAAVPATASEVDEIVVGIETFYKEVTDFKAAFTQVVQRAHLPRPLKKTGNVYFKAPGMMRWDYLQPDRVYYISDGAVLWSYEAATKQAIKMGVKDSELYDSLKFLFGQGDLRTSFEITKASLSKADEAAGDIVGIKLIPRAGQNNYKSLTLFARRGRWEIVKTELVDPLDNVSTITFEGAIYETLKSEGFKFKPPKGATIKDLLGKTASP